MASTLSNNTVHDFEFAGSANIPDFEKKFQNGDFDFIYSNPYHALMAYQQQGYVPIIRDGSRIEINEKNPLTQTRCRTQSV